jgi:hypothetical protein
VRITSCLVKSIRELVESRGDLDALQKNLSLALHLDILGPLNVASEVTLGGDGVTNAEVSGLGVEQRKVRVFLDLLVDLSNSLTSRLLALLARFGGGFGGSLGGSLGGGLGSCRCSSGLAATLRGRLLGRLKMKENIRIGSGKERRFKRSEK